MSLHRRESDRILTSASLQRRGCRTKNIYVIIASVFMLDFRFSSVCLCVCSRTRTGKQGRYNQTPSSILKMVEMCPKSKISNLPKRASQSIQPQTPVTLKANLYVCVEAAQQVNRRFLSWPVGHLSINVMVEVEPKWSGFVGRDSQCLVLAQLFSTWWRFFSLFYR